MTQANDLVGLGIPPVQAEALGITPVTLAGVGTAQSGAAAVATSGVLATTDSGQTAFVLGANWPLWTPIWFFNTSATTALVFPPSGGAIDGGSADASVNVAQNKGRILLRVSATGWRSLLSA